jgi:hypothetical protein
MIDGCSNGSKKAAKTILLWALLLGAGFCQYNCNGPSAGCSNNGECDKTGYCICKLGFIGDDCSKSSNTIIADSGLSKSFLVFWILFWIIINFLIPYVIYMLIVYLKNKNCDTLKEQYKLLKEAFCCCLIKNPSYRSASSVLVSNQLKTLHVEEPQRRLLAVQVPEQPTLINPNLSGSTQAQAKPRHDLTRYKQLSQAVGADGFNLIERAREEIKTHGFTPGTKQMLQNENEAALSEPQISEYQSSIKDLKDKITKECVPQGTTFEGIQNSLLSSLAAGLKSPADSLPKLA